MANTFEHIVDPHRAPETGTYLDEAFRALSSEAIAEAVALTAWESMSPSDRQALQQESAVASSGNGVLAQLYARDVLVLRASLPEAS